VNEPRPPATDARPEAATTRPDLLIELEGDIGSVAPGLDAVRAYLQPFCVDEGCAYNAELVFEELFTNAVRHGFHGQPGHRVAVRMHVDGDAVLLELADDGPAFDPTAYRSRPAPARLEEATRGGVGLKLVRSASRSFEYSRRDGLNVVRVTIAR